MEKHGHSAATIDHRTIQRSDHAMGNYLITYIMNIVFKNWQSVAWRRSFSQQQQLAANQQWHAADVRDAAQARAMIKALYQNWTINEIVE